MSFRAPNKFTLMFCLSGNLKYDNIIKRKIMHTELKKQT